MKPTKLVISAFGPYLNKTEIDFSKLGSDGIYLITGDTGAGKSTIFEALSYALYGETVSGNDRSASMLRNRSAEDDTETYVELDFISNGKNYHIRRSPKYLLNKLKKARKVSDQDDTPKHSEHGNKFELNCIDEGIIYTNEKEGNEKIYDIVGISKENFKKICMIAQGEFMSVIREKTEKRGEILNSIFGTENYVKLADKLKEYTSDAKSKKESVSNELSAAMKLISCGGQSEYASDTNRWLELGITTVEDIDMVIELAEKIIAQDDELNIIMQKLSEDNKKESDEVKAKLHTANIVLGYKKQLSEKNKQISEMQQLLPVLEERQQQTKDNPAKASEKESRAEVIRSKISDYDRLDTQVAEKNKAEKASADGERKLESENTKKKQLEKEITAAKVRIAELDGIEGKRAEEQSELDRQKVTGKKLRTLQNDYNSSMELAETAEKIRLSYEKAREDYIKQNTLFVRIQTAFLDNQAGIISQKLEEGKPCPVCGSLHHPNPAKPEHGAPSEEEVKEAKASTEKLDKLMQSENTKYTESKANAENAYRNVKKNAEEILGEEIDDSVLKETIDSTLDKYLASAVKLQNDIRSLDLLITEKNQLSKKVETMQTDIEIANLKITALTGETKENSAKAKALSENISELTAKLEFPSKAAAEKEIGMLLKQAQELKKAYEDSKKALDNHKKTIGEISAAAEVLKNQIAKEEHYDLEALNKKAEELAAGSDNIEKQLRQFAIRLDNNKKAVSVLNAKKDIYKKASDHYKNCKALSDTANGNIKLATYVQAAYFERVLVRANSRMNKMTDGRYQLVRCEEITDKRKGAGLDINILDNESGKERAVGTLSGGESFMAALALSLGLSDEIQSGSGGIHLDTMFIDEGFGSLDDRSLEKAVQTLKNLSSGSCLIGIISHVGRLKEMINKRITVTKDNNITKANVEL